jgi:hypothetical protein
MEQMAETGGSRKRIVDFMTTQENCQLHDDPRELCTSRQPKKTVNFTAIRENCGLHEG